MEPSISRKTFSNRESLDKLIHAVDLITRGNTTQRQMTAIPGLWFNRREKPTELHNIMHQASVCVILQGAKEVHLKQDVYKYDDSQFLMTPIDLPVQARVSKSSAEKPFLDMVLSIDRDAIIQMMLDSKYFPSKETSTTRGMVTIPLTDRIVDAFWRLVELLETPEDISGLAPLIHKEILYRIMSSDGGHSIRQIGLVGSRSHQISNAIDLLKKNYDQPLSIDELASSAGMSRSTLHQHFKELTAMSPLQYQKWIRLNEARKLMFTYKVDAATASYKVGYESPSQFSREYRRHFGMSPIADIKHLNQAAN